MNIHGDKIQQNRNKAVVNELLQKQNKKAFTFQFVDNRPEAISQMNPQALANSSSRVAQLRAFHEMADSSAQTKQAFQAQAMANTYTSRQHQPIQKKENNTGLPDDLKAGIENLSGYSMDDVKAHYNSDKPAQLNAHAYAQGTDIHLAPGQEKHLAHEAWHVVQQKQGRVKPTMQMKDKVNVNDDPGLEKEADVMGAKALQLKQTSAANSTSQPFSGKKSSSSRSTIQKIRDLNAPQTQSDFKANHNRGDDANEEDTLEVVSGNYHKSLASGQRLMDKGLKWFTNAHDKEPQINTIGTFQNVVAAGYKVFWFFPNEDSVTICMIRGKEFSALESREVDGYSFDDFEDDQDFMYANTFNVKTGEFHASINYRSLDSEVAIEEGLPPALSNSEIIWFQQEFAKKVYRKKYPDSGGLSAITSISREQIGNTQTLDTIFMCDEDRIAYTDGTVTLYQPTAEALALLGTPNGNSSVWMLIQHAASGKVDIRSVEYSKDGLKINYMYL